MLYLTDSFNIFLNKLKFNPAQKKLSLWHKKRLAWVPLNLLCFPAHFPSDLRNLKRLFCHCVHSVLSGPLYLQLLTGFQSTQLLHHSLYLQCMPMWQRSGNIPKYVLCHLKLEQYSAYLQEESLKKGAFGIWKKNKKG